MVRGRIRFIAAVGTVVAGSTVLAACGGAGTGALVSSHATTHDGAVATAATTTTTTTMPTPTPTPTTTMPTTTSPTAGSTAGSSTSTGRHPLLIVRAFDGSVLFAGTRPATIDVSGDSSNIVQHVTWRSWGPTSAIGHGTLGVNNCQPNCATGTIRYEPASIRLSGVVHGHFTAMTENAYDFVRTFSYPSNWVAGAS